MLFGLQHPNFTYDHNQPPQVMESLKTLVKKLEYWGFDSFWVMDHFHQISVIGLPEEPILEGWSTISALAPLTSKIRLGVLVTGVIHRHPSILAKIAATVDILSKGRIFLGIGAAWNDAESIAYGIVDSFPSNKERLDRLEEAIQIIRKMWTEEPNASFTGKYYKIKNAYCNPKPIQKPSPPILVGGGGEKRTLKIVAKYADACNLIGSYTTIERKLKALKEHCISVGRNYDDILKTKLCRVVIDPDIENAKKRTHDLLRGMSDEKIREFAIFGAPEDVSKEIRMFEDIGIEYLIVNLEPSSELNTVDIFASKIMRNYSTK